MFDSYFASNSSDEYENNVGAETIGMMKINTTVFFSKP